jgi:hypothetical protein
MMGAPVFVTLKPTVDLGVMEDIFRAFING